MTNWGFLSRWWIGSETTFCMANVPMLHTGSSKRSPAAILFDHMSKNKISTSIQRDAWVSRSGSDPIEWTPHLQKKQELYKKSEKEKIMIK